MFLLMAGLVVGPGALGAADQLPKDPSNSTNLYYVMKRLRAQQLARQRPPVNRYEMGYQRLNRKLASIRFKEVVFDGLTLDEVIQYLSEEIRKRDPAKKGINFMYLSPTASFVQGPGIAGGALPGAAPLIAAVQDGQAAPVVAPPAVVSAAPDLAGVIINLRQPMRNLTALQVLDVVAKSADQPIMFTVNDYSVVAMPKAPGSANVFGARFRANPDTFRQGLQNVTPVSVPTIGNSTGNGGGN